MVGGDAVKAVAMDDEITFILGGRVDVFLFEADGTKGQRQKAFEDIVVIPAQVNHLGVFILHFFQDRADHPAVNGLPFGAALQSPSVDDVAIKHKFFATDVFQKADDFFGLTFGSAEMDVRQENCAAFIFLRFDFFALGIEHRLSKPR